MWAKLAFVLWAVGSCATADAEHITRRQLDPALFAAGQGALENALQRCYDEDFSAVQYQRCIITTTLIAINTIVASLPDTFKESLGYVTDAVTQAQTNLKSCLKKEKAKAINACVVANFKKEAAEAGDQAKVYLTIMSQYAKDIYACSKGDVEDRPECSNTAVKQAIGGIIASLFAG